MRFFDDGPLLLIALLTMAAVFYKIRWGIGFWHSLREGGNGPTGSLMIYFFALANFFLAALFVTLSQASFVPVGYVPIARWWYLTTLAVWLMTARLADREFEKARKKKD